MTSNLNLESVLACLRADGPACNESRRELNIEYLKPTGIKGRLHIALYATRNLPSRRSVEVDRVVTQAK